MQCMSRGSYSLFSDKKFRQAVRDRGASFLLAFLGFLPYASKYRENIAINRLNKHGQSVDQKKLELATAYPPWLPAADFGNPC